MARKGMATSGLTGSVPTPAAQVGYLTNTFSSTFNNDVDLAKSLNSGFKWYPYNYFGSAPDMSKVIVSGGSPLVLQGDTTGPNGEIMSCAVKSGSYVGTAFGGGMYVEGVLKFDPATVPTQGAGGWPSFWCLPIEKGLAPIADHWPGQAAGYEHYLELDIMEYIWMGARPSTYCATMHDWYGVYTSLGDVSNVPANVVPVSNISLFNNFHQYGVLWVPATASTQGYVQYYFDRAPVGTRFSWDQYTGQAPTPVGKAWRWGVIDIHHHSLILGTGPGANLTVQSVDVWQASAANNLSI